MTTAYASASGLFRPSSFSFRTTATAMHYLANPLPMTIFKEKEVDIAGAEIVFEPEVSTPPQSRLLPQQETDAGKLQKLLSANLQEETHEEKIKRIKIALRRRVEEAKKNGTYVEPPDYFSIL